jgi:hypothetical protein
MLRHSLLIAAFAALAACASTPAYGPAPSARGAGYSETQVESNRYFVTYRAAGPADAQLLQDYAMLRAAEITLQHGRDWFWVDRRSLDDAGASGGGPSVGIGIGGGNWGRHSGLGVGVGLNIPLGGAPAGSRARGASVEIRFGEGVKPDDANAYDAHALSTNIRARLEP